MTAPNNVTPPAVSVDEGKPRRHGNKQGKKPLFKSDRQLDWGCGSVGRAFRSQRKGRGFDSRLLHFFWCLSLVFVVSLTFSFLLVILNMST